MKPPLSIKVPYPHCGNDPCEKDPIPPPENPSFEKSLAPNAAGSFPVNITTPKRHYDGYRKTQCFSKPSAVVCTGTHWPHMPVDAL